MSSTVQKAADDVDAAQNFFDDKPKEQKAKPQADNSGKIAQLQREKKQLQERIEINKNQYKIDLQHAKQKAKEMYEQMMEQKLNACRKAYEEEFEIIARQFEDFKIEIDE